MDLEVNVYIKNLKNYLESNDDYREYFLGDSLELDDFLEMVSEMAQQNVNEGKEPQLTQNQFEKIRSKNNMVIIKGEAPILIFSEEYPPLFLN